jgi:spermidine synthase
MSPHRRFQTILFLLFTASGFCSLLYQVVWVRMAFASFGVITPVLSVVLSVFMLGLAAGSWVGGRAIDGLSGRTGVSPVVWYGLAELCTGIGGIVVPWLFRAGERMLLPLGEMDSFRYLLMSAVVLGLSLLPWCFCMGTTFPFMMAFIRNYSRGGEKGGFSFLYLANVIGAMGGTLLTALVLIEWMGFRGASLSAAVLNGIVALTAFGLAAANRPGSLRGCDTVRAEPSRPARTDPAAGGRHALPLLFATGLVSMAMEVVWTRAFTPVLHTTIYAFASLLATYLCATWIGSLAYRRCLSRNVRVSTGVLTAWLSVSALLPVLVDDPRISPPAGLVLAGIVPFCAILGFLTPRLIDAYSGGAPKKAGGAYAINTVGCILGPLLAGYVLLPFIGVRYASVLLALPLAAAFLILSRRPAMGRGHRALAGGLLALSTAAALFVSAGYEDGSGGPERVVRRDHAATVISEGSGMHKKLLVNGIGMTVLTPITKVMAHLPLSSLRHEPRSAAAICLGMGTTFRSLAAWGIDATAVELVPGVRDAFGYYFADAAGILARPGCRIVVDDGRRFLKRTTRLYDVITIDPPPPVEASGSSLLYSSEFYDCVKKRLAPGGILQQWFPRGEWRIRQAAARSIAGAFPYVRVFRSIEDWGVHFLASMEPIGVPSCGEFVRRLPPAAAADLLEWANGTDIEAYAAAILSREIPLADVIEEGFTSSITDDRPFNEYYFVRRTKARLREWLRPEKAVPAGSSSNRPAG